MVDTAIFNMTQTVIFNNKKLEKIEKEGDKELIEKIKKRRKKHVKII